MKTLAIRLEDDLHARLAIVAQLRDSTITEEIRQAIDAHIEAQRSAPELTAKADGALAEIEREASTRRDAIAALFGDDTKPASSPRSRAKKAAEEEPPAAS